jgi:hypothetical protein
MINTWHSSLSANATPFNRSAGMMNVATPFGAGQFDAFISWRAMANAYSEDFFFLALLVCPLLIFTWMMKKPQMNLYFGAPPPRPEVEL